MSSAGLSGINKWFDDVQVLHDVSFHAEAGEFVVLLGPSGCGKSTALRLIAGLEAAQEGDILIGDARVNHLPAAERGIAMVFQSYALFPHLTVAENIVFGLRVRRVAAAERAQRLQRAAELLGLEAYLDRRPAQLSGGQRQRVALGRALVSGASVVLMDEPLSNLDARLRQQMRVELRELQRALGLTVIYVTHDQVEAMTMADRVVVMRNGRIDQIAAPRTLYETPARVEVARFIGAPPMALLDATADAGRVRIDGTDVELRAMPATELPERLLLGVRAEDVLPEPVPGAVALPARVGMVELLGSDLLVRLSTGASAEITARLPVRTPIETGEWQTVALPADRLHLFDAATGRRLAEARLVATPDPVLVAKQARA